MTHVLRTVLLCLAATAWCLTGTAAAPADSNKTVPLYRTAHDAPLRATEKLLEAAEGHTKLRIEFNGIEGDRVPGHLYLPKKPDGRRPAVLVQHGIGDKKQAEYIFHCCRLLAEQGVVALAIDAPRRGERRNNQPSPAWWDMPQMHRWFQQHCGDYSRAFDYLATRADVDKTRLGYIGFSWGGITGVTYAAYDPRVRTVVCVGGGGKLIGLLGVPMADRPDVPVLDPAYHVARIAPRPLLMINAKKDAIVLRPFATALHQAAGEGSKVAWYDTNHYFEGVDRPKIMQSIVDFMKDGLARNPLPPARQ